MRRLEEARARELQYRENQQPPRPKSAPLTDKREDDDNASGYGQPNHGYATLGRSSIRDGQENR